MTKRFLTLFMALVLLAAAIPMTVSAEYENTHSNTGNQRYDIIQVALTQVGYKEGANNYTKYGQYFGNANAPWCGYFVSWCAAQAEVPTSVMRRQGIASPSSFGLSTFTASQRTPQPGDLYFTTSNSHVGFVYKVEGSYFWSVEGNSRNQVEIEKLNLYGSYKFASPNYGGSNNSSHTHSMESAFESAHPHKEYQYCTSCDYTRYTGEVTTMADCQTCIQENCTHQYGDWIKVDDSNHKKVCSLCQKEVTASHDWKDVQVLKEATCAVSGSVSQSCETCGGTRTKTVSKTDDHNYGEWELKDDEVHMRKCTVCGSKETEDHKVENEEEPWQTTEEEHWQECTVCGEKFLCEEHEFGEDCVEPCQICEYVRPEGHAFSEEWLMDAQTHWQECSACGELSIPEEHTYSAECDEDCDVCGFTREVEHTFGQTMKTDGASHWYECDVCGKVEGLEDHIPGAEATEENAQLCTVCQYELVAQIEHIHDYHPISYDNQMHWGTCRCGDELGPEVHAWDMATGACSVCGVRSVAETESQSWEFVWYIMGGAVLCTVIVAASVAAHNRKKRREMDGDPYWA